MSKIIGVTVGSPLPKPNLKQTDPNKGDYVKGKDIIPAKVSQLENDAEYIASNDLTGAVNDALAQAKASGEFDGSDGKDGENGVSIVAVSQTTTSFTDGGANIVTVTLGDGNSSQFTVRNGSKGSKGADGVSATHSWSGTTLTVTSASGTSSANLKGDKGDKGDSVKGDDGVSPTVAVSKSGKVTTISITDKSGTKTATINDGVDGSSGSNGKDGTSVTVKSVSESSADGGNNVVTFSDGKTVTIKNGSKGSAGSNGSNGTSVTVSNVSTSSADGGSNVVTFSDGKTLTVKNGSKGSTGATGADGKTPVRGTDYWTTADQEAIVQQVIAALGTPVFGRVDADNNIILTGELADGTYTVKYEDADGEVTEIGTLNNIPVPTYTNVLPLATTNDGKTVYNGTGYKVGARIGSSGSEGTVGNTAATNPIFLTGYIKVPAGATIRMENCFIDTNGVNGTINNTADKNYYGHELSGLYGCMVYTNLYAPTFDDTTTNYHWSTFANYSLCTPKPTVDGNGYVTEFTLNTTTEKYIRMHLGGDPTKAIITVNEPITD